MEKPKEAPKPVSNLQKVCADILARAVPFQGGQAWSKRGSEWGRGYVNSFSSAPLALLQKKGVLRRVFISSISPLKDQLPEHFFRTAMRSSRLSGCPLYIIQDREQLGRLARETATAGDWLGYRVADPSQLGFNEAIDRVKAEIAAHPDPARFFVTVVRRLCP